jgi:hypothetical protein
MGIIQVKITLPLNMRYTFFIKLKKLPLTETY